MAAHRHAITIGSDETSPTANAHLRAIHDNCYGREYETAPMLNVQIWNWKLYVMIDLVPLYGTFVDGVALPYLQAHRYHVTLAVGRFRTDPPFRELHDLRTVLEYWRRQAVVTRLRARLLRIFHNLLPDGPISRVGLVPPPWPRSLTFGIRDDDLCLVVMTVKFVAEYLIEGSLANLRLRARRPLHLSWN